MAEYIERDGLIAWIERQRRLSKLTTIMAIQETPAADVAPVVHGRWELERQPDGKPYCFHCSVCDGDFHHIGITQKYNYCPNCGARMDLKEGKNDGTVD